ncbi:ABC transporter ATP-binding protein/permease [Providencia rettgeri]|uniref:ABC transporter ATP-binding protein/permease n=1 Tax=Providencia rettgeri TaxID=587 RepID=UPI00155E8FCB|nr:ABC transporter ATP-binding protein/permease [Providencia rettgeri]MBI6191367.1 ABC transporter ATP-binding protein/permease [Providencia rettgeri]QKG43627.1 ABC transporter ATP-binding protein/permease [Providencia rettgeri]QNN33756.1 ABC transporter ATP-binding protein/permease [Providencia rettgeri]
MKTLKQFFYLVKPFWGQRAALLCWILLFASLGLTLSSVWFNVKMNMWNGDFYNALQKLDGQALYGLLQYFVILVSGLIFVVVMGNYLKQMLIIRWRKGMTEQVLSRWLSPNSKHYLLRLTSQEPDNPDQRIAEDIRLLIESTLNLVVTFLHSMLTLISFAAILWTLSGSLSFNFADSDWTIPGYMFWACIIYTLIGIALTQWIGFPLRRLHMDKQRREADYRSSLINCRQHGDAIAGQRGETQDRKELMGRFGEIISNWNRLIRCERNLSFYTVGYQQVTALAPVLLALPKFLAGEIMLGGLMQLRQAFTSVATSLGWFIFAYKEIAAWQATVSRLYNFVVLLENDNKAVVTIDEKSLPLVAKLSVSTADNRCLINSVNITAKQGELTLISGRSGVGKSTLLRTLSGHWPFFNGTISRTEKVMWIPQRLYLPISRLDSLLAYPKAASQFSQQDFQYALMLVGLEKLHHQLALETDWNNRLSGGEQQRIMFARLLLNRPKLLLLDETTSALDENSALELLALLKAELHDSAIVLVSHQSFVAQFAEQQILLVEPASEKSLNTGTPEYAS